MNLGEEQLRQAGALLESSGLAGLRPGAGPRRSARSPRPSKRRWRSWRGEDARAFREDLGLSEPGLDRVIRTSYALLGLISFLTAGEDECRAWTIRRGTRAQQAAGTIHSDIERGFIRAEVVRLRRPHGGRLACRPAARRARCAWKARNTSCRTAT